MNTTQRLYHEDPERRTFTARVLEVRSGKDDKPHEVILDQTAFYPTGGGQPHDLGLLGGVRVVDVVEEDDLVIHVLDGPISEPEVEGHVDWDRRLDHRQQHTGQHILSRAFVGEAEAATVGFHLGLDVCSIDLDREVGEEAVTGAEDLGNRVVQEDHPVRVAVYSNARDLPLDLRKEPVVESGIRVVSVGEFDASPCCGTHCTSTGQVGVIKILRSERHRGGTRVEFVCGQRAVEDYRLRHRALREVALAFTAGDFSVPDRVRALQLEAKTLRGQVERAERELRSHCLKEWTEEVQDGPFVKNVGDGRASWLAPVGNSLVGQREEMILLYSRDGDTVRFLLASPEQETVEAGLELKKLLEAVGGRAGGSRTMGQGVASVEKLEHILKLWGDARGKKE